jgi:hypothetical protein
MRSIAHERPLPRAALIALAIVVAFAIFIALAMIPDPTERDFTSLSDYVRSLVRVEHAYQEKRAAFL